MPSRPTAGLPEVVGWLALAALALVVGSYGGQVLRGPLPDTADASFAPERIARLGPPGPAELVTWLPATTQPPAAAPPVPPVAVLLPTGQAPSAPVTPAPSVGGRTPVEAHLARPIQARVELAAVRFEPRAPRLGRRGAPAVDPAQRLAPPTPGGDDAPALVATTDHPVSTFSPDPEGTGWSHVRAALAEGRLPHPDAVRIEDLVNAQAAMAPAPAPGQPVGVDVELSPHPWRPGRHLMRLGLRAADAPRGGQQAPLELTLLVDTSGSMALDDRLEHVRAGLHSLVGRLGPQDGLSLLRFADDAELRVAAGAPDATALLHREIDALRADGASATAAALAQATAEAMRHYLPGGDNRIVLVTDGEANVGVAELEGMSGQIRQAAARGLVLDVVAVGGDAAATAPVARLAALGGGQLWVVDDFEAARDVLGRAVLGEPARAPTGVEVAVAFDPAAVSGWRLAGHDKGGGAAALPPLHLAPGQAVTALYEIALAPGWLGAALDQELAQIRLRTTGPDGAALLSWAVGVPRRLVQGDFEASSRQLRVALAAARFGELLRRPAAAVEAWAQAAALVEGPDARAEDRQLGRMILQSGRLALRDGAAASSATSPAAGSSTRLRAAASADDLGLLSRRLLHTQDSLSPCASRQRATGRLDLALEIERGEVVEAAAAFVGQGARDVAELEACAARTARSWRFPSGWNAHLEVPMQLEHRDGTGVGG